jgi:hypothetical protein
VRGVFARTPTVLGRHADPARGSNQKKKEEEEAQQAAAKAKGMAEVVAQLQAQKEELQGVTALQVPLAQVAPTPGWAAISSYMETAQELFEKYKSGMGGVRKFRILLVPGPRFDMLAKIQDGTRPHARRWLKRRCNNKHHATRVPDPENLIHCLGRLAGGHDRGRVDERRGSCAAASSRRRREAFLRAQMESSAAFLWATRTATKGGLGRPLPIGLGGAAPCVTSGTGCWHRRPRTCRSPGPGKCPFGARFLAAASGPPFPRLFAPPLEHRRRRPGGETCVHKRLLSSWSRERAPEAHVSSGMCFTG